MVADTASRDFSFSISEDIRIQSRNPSRRGGTELQCAGMTARTHDAIAFTSLVTVAAYYPPVNLTLLTVFVSLVGNVIGALLPDIDQAANRLWDLLPSGNEVGKILRNLFLHHRTVTHSLLGVFLTYKLFLWLLPLLLNSATIDMTVVTWSIIIGYVSHLAADSFTKEGLPLLFPLQWKIGIPPLKALRITTGEWIENYLVLPGVGVYLVWFVWTYQIMVMGLVRVIHLQ